MRHTVLIALSGLIFSGCQSAEKAPEEDFLGKYERPLPAGASAFQKVPSAQWPDVGANYRRNPTDLVKAGKRSLAWFDKESTQTHFPIEGISHDHAKASVERLLQLLRTSRNRFAQRNHTAQPCRIEPSALGACLSPRWSCGARRRSADPAA